MHVFHNKFRMIMSHDKKTLSLNFKSSCSQMFYKIGVLIENPPRVFSGKYCKIFKDSYFEEHVQMAASSIITYNIKLVITYWAYACKSINVEWFLLRRFLDLVRNIRILIGLDRFCPLLNVYS